MLCQQRDVICPLSQWWDLNRKHIEPVVKVLTKAARHHFLLQVTIGRSDDPHIREPRPVFAHALVTLLLQDAEQFALQFQRNFSNFIEENRPSFSRLETSGAVLDRPGKSTARVAEEFAFIQLFWDRGAIDADERFVLAPAALVNFPRDQFLARAGFTENENRSICRRDQINLADDVPQWCALADEVAKGFGFHHFLLEVGVPLFELGLETLYLLKGPRVGDGSADVIGKDLLPRPTFIRYVLTSKCGNDSQKLAFESDRRSAESTNLLSHQTVKF